MRDLKAYARQGDGWLRDLLLLTVVLGLPFLQFLGGLPLIDPDEGRYAEIPREMLERGDLITPTLNYVKYFEKPPLLYWLNAASLKLFGVNEWAARLPSALAGLATVLVTYLVARRLYGRRTALLAAAILGTSAGFVMQSRLILTDMLLTCCLTACLGAFIVAASRERRHSTPLSWYIFYAASALAVLTKGLIGLVFPGGIIFFYLLFTGQWRLLGRMRLAGGVLLFLAVTAPWFVVVSLKNPEFARFFFIHEHFERFTSTVHGRYQPFWFFVPVLIGTMLPWAFFIPGALGRAWRERRNEEGRGGLYLLIWILLIFLFFSKSSSKLVPYILPIFPPLAILIARRFTTSQQGRASSLVPAALVCGLVLLLLGIGAAGYANLSFVAGKAAALFPSQAESLQRFASVAPAISRPAGLAIALLFLIQGGVLLYRPGRYPAVMVAVLCSASLLLEILVPRAVMGDIARTESRRELAQAARPLLTPETRLVSVGPQQGLSWYLQRRIMVTGNRDELDFGSKQGDQSAWFPDRPTLIRMWQEKTPLLLFLRRNELAELQPLLVHPKLRVIKESGRYLLISNR